MKKHLTNSAKEIGTLLWKKFIIPNNISSIPILGKPKFKNSLSKVLHTLFYSFPIDFEEKKTLYELWLEITNV